MIRFLRKLGHTLGRVLAETRGYYICDCCGIIIDIPMNKVGCFLFKHDANQWRAFE